MIDPGPAIESHIENIIEQSFDFKSKLIEWAQQQKKDLRFNTTPNADPDNMFTCSVVLDQVLIASGKERSKKKAEQSASKLACESLSL